MREAPAHSTRSLLGEAPRVSTRLTKSARESLSVPHVGMPAKTVSIVGYGTSSGILNHGKGVLVRRDYSPVLRQAELHTITIPCWDNRRLSS